MAFFQSLLRRIRRLTSNSSTSSLSSEDVVFVDEIMEFENFSDISPERTVFADGAAEREMLEEERKYHNEIVQEEIRARHLQRETARRKLESELRITEERRKSAQILRSENPNVVPLVVEIYASSGRLLKDRSFVLPGEAPVSKVLELARSYAVMEEEQALTCSIQDDFPSSSDLLEVLYRVYPEEDRHLHLKFTVVTISDNSSSACDILKLSWRLASLYNRNVDCDFAGF